MISKKIHYCWFGGKPIPEKYKAFIKTWKDCMPEYEVYQWDEQTFDVESTSWTLGAYKAGKYAFVSDFVRLKALYEHGGIYLDTDVKMIKSLAPLQQTHPTFMGFENNHVITSAVIAAEKGSDLIKEFLSYYENKDFSLDIVTNNEANVLMMTDTLKKYGLKINAIEQHIETKFFNVHVFPPTYFCPLDFYHREHFSDNTHTIHYFDGSWLPKETKKRMIYERSFMYKVQTTIMNVLSFLKHQFVR